MWFLIPVQEFLWSIWLEKGLWVTENMHPSQFLEGAPDCFPEWLHQFTFTSTWGSLFPQMELSDQWSELSNLTFFVFYHHRVVSYASSPILISKRLMSLVHSLLFFFFRKILEFFILVFEDLYFHFNLSHWRMSYSQWSWRMSKWPRLSTQS